MAVTGSVGGPVIDVGPAPIPLPLSTLGVRVGVSERSDVALGVHPSLAAMFGVWGVDAGGSYLVLKPDGPRPAVLIDARTSFIWGDTAQGAPAGGLRNFTDVAALASWAWTPRDHLVYVGAETFFQPVPFRPTAGLVAGNQFRVSPAVGATVEVKWMQGHVNTDDLTLTYFGPWQQGALVVQAGLSVAFGGKEAP